MRLLIVAAVCVALASAGTPRFHSDPLFFAFQAWKVKYGKSYDTAVEEALRFDVWKTNAEFVMNHNLKYELGLSTFDTETNGFADLSSDEFAATYLGFKSLLSARLDIEEPQSVSTPTTQDWRTHGWVTPVKDQGQCGSCWSFSATGGLEGQHKNVSGTLVSLSEQQQVDCNKNCNGCNGGNMDVAFNWWKSNGGATGESDYPYTAKDGTCQTGKPIRAKINGYTDIAYGSESALQVAVGNVGPVSVAIDASHSSFQNYKSGVYYEPACSSRILDHGVLNVGYNTDNGDEYWIVKNSWGTSWGQSGYIWMSRNKNNNCGIASQASYPIGAN